MSMSFGNSLRDSNVGPQRNSSQDNLIPHHNGNQKKLKILLVGLSLIVVALVIALSVVAAKKHNPNQVIWIKPTTTTAAPAPPICNRPECRDAAAYFLKIMNPDADPCNDFYGFVCGKWSNETEVPKEKSRYGTFEELEDDLADTCIEQLESSEVPDVPAAAVQKAQALYQACVKSESVDALTGANLLREVLQKVNISSNITLDEDTSFDIYHTLSEITKNFGLNFIINFMIGPDDMNTKKNIIILDQPEKFGLGRNFLLGNKTSDRVLAYKKYITTSLCLLFDPPNTACSVLENIVDDIFDFEANITQMTRDQIERRSAWTWYHKKTFKDLKENVTKIDFLQYSKNILGSIGDSLTNETEVIVKEENYFLQLSLLLDSQDDRVQSNYLAWRLIQYFGPLLFKEFRTIQFEFDKVNEGIKKQKDIKNVCFQRTNEYFGHAIGRIYVDQKFTEQSKKDVEDMVTNLMTAFGKMLDKNDWMDETTKEKSRTKLTKMFPMIGYPDWSKIDEELNKYYNVSGMKKNDLLASLHSIKKFLAEKTFSKLDEVNNRTSEWVISAAIVNAVYNPSANTITFPAGILQIPFYGKRPKYLNYGAIGYVIGHEITHGYDDQGSEFDGDGNLEKWWTDETRAEFDSKKQCFIDQYSNIVDPLTGLHLNGENTIGENIADNGGIREAYQAYLISGQDNERLPGLTQYNDLQLFFMSAASTWCTKITKEAMVNAINENVHSPGMYRAYIPLSNTVEFAQVFGCPKGTVMNPAHQCTMW